MGGDEDARRASYYGATCEKLRREVLFWKRRIGDVARGTAVCTLFRCGACGREFPSIVELGVDGKVHSDEFQCVGCKRMTCRPIYPHDLPWAEDLRGSR